jgi:hypothetical protein
MEADFVLDDAEEELARKKIQLDPEYKGFLADLRDVVGHPGGARVICTLLERLGTFEPAYSEKNAKLIYKVVLKDFGNDILDDLATASAAAHDDIQRMMRIRRKLDEGLLT